MDSRTFASQYHAGDDGPTLHIPYDKAFLSNALYKPRRFSNAQDKQTWEEQSY